MAKSLADSGTWLNPSQFLPHNHNALTADFAFPSEFPYEFGLSSPAVESVAGSTETESSDEEEDFFLGLTRRLSQSSLHETRKQLTALPISTHDKPDEFPLSKTRAFAGSPQSTLTGIGSWSGRSAVSGDGSPNGYSRVPSPSTAPFADPWEVIYEAAGQVARLKMNNQVSNFDFQNKPLGPTFGANLNKVQQQVKQKQQHCGSVWGRQVKPNNWFSQQQQLQIQNRGRDFCYENGKCNRSSSLPQSTWPPLQVQHQNQQRLPFNGSGSGSRVVLPSGSSVKKGCGGTGVFLPRHYETPSDSRKKTGCAPVLLPAKVVHALNMNIDDLNATSQTRFPIAFSTDYDALLANRNTLLMQQRLSVRREEVTNYEIRLPQEWTY